MDVLQQSNNLRTGFINYLQSKQAAGIVNSSAPGSQTVSISSHVNYDQIIIDYFFFPYLARIRNSHFPVKRIFK